MAVLERIRKRAGVFIMIFVGVALVLFIVDQNTIAYLFNNTSNDVAVIDKQKVDYNEFYDFMMSHQAFMQVAQNKTSLNEDDNATVRALAWEDVLKKYVLEPRFNKLGLKCSNDELEDLLYGSNISEVISQNFVDPQTGIIDTVSIRRFFDEAYSNPQIYVITEYWRKNIQDQRQKTKFNNLVSKAMYMPSALAEKSYHENNDMFDFEYIVKNYRDISDDSIEITEADYQNYYKEHQGMFKEKEQIRDVEYVVFFVIPSETDTINVYNKIVELRNDMLSIDDGSYLEFAERQSDIDFPAKFIDERSMTPALVFDNFFNEEVGAVSNIYLQDDSYYFTKIVDESMRPDSAMASHILIAPNQERDIKSCRQIVDSLFSLIKSGSNFDILAIENSDDPGSKNNGGDLGWFTDGVMVPEFNEACFAGKVGDLKIVETQFGIHILKVVKQTAPSRKVKLASISKEIRPSVKTNDYYYSKASAFAIENNNEEKFEQAVEDEKLVKRVASKLNAMGNNIPGVSGAREIVQWAFNEKTKKGDVSHVFSFEDQFVVAKLSLVNEKGVLILEEAKETIEPILIRNKKAEMIIADLNKELSNTKNLSDLAGRVSASVDTCFRVAFGSFSIPSLGVEPNVNAVVSQLGDNVLSSPIKGNSGVFVVKLISKSSAPEKSDFTEEQNSAAKTLSNQVFRLIETIKDKADVKDNRVKYF